MKDPYVECPQIVTESFTIRVLKAEDFEGLFDCYHDELAVKFMNDDNCDFGFYVDTKENMAKTVSYWVDFYQKRYFIRFSIIDNATQKPVGTIEGFNAEIGVLRVDICPKYEQEKYLRELFSFAKDNFKELFQNECLVTKAIEEATERREALSKAGWEFIDEYKGFKGYYKIELK